MHRLVACVLALAYMSLVWWLSAQARPPLVPELPFPHADKLVHLIEYGVLGFLWCHALAHGEEGSARRRALVIAVLITAHYGVIDELHQGYVPNRTSSVADAAADLTGALLAALVWARWVKR